MKPMVFILMLVCLVFTPIIAGSSVTEQAGNKNTRQAGGKSAEAFSLFHIADKYEKKYNYGKALEHYFKALNIFEELDNKEYVNICYIRIGRNYNSQSHYSQAIPYHKKALAICRENDYDKLIEIYNGISYSYVMLGNYASAIDYTTKSLRAAEIKGDREKTAYLINNIAIIYLNWKNYDQALVYLDKSLKIAEDINNNRVKNMVFSSFSEVYYEKNMIKEAIDFENRALRIAIDLNDSVVIGRSYYFLSLCYDKLGKTENSIELKLKYLKLLERIGDKPGQVNDLYAIGESYIKSGQYDFAREYFTRSLSLAEDIKYLRFIVKSSYSLSEAYLALGDYKQAHKYLKQYTLANDSLFSEESEKKLQTLQIKHETEKKEKENAALKERNSIQLRYFVVILVLTLIMLILLFNRYRTRKKSLRLISQKNARIEEVNAQLKTINDHVTSQNLELEALNQELSNRNNLINKQNADLEHLNRDLYEANASKDKFFLILSHELLNPLRWLSNVCDILIKKLEIMDKAKLRETVELLGNSARESNQLLENLLLWAKIHTDRINLSPERLCLETLIHENIELVQARLQDKQITVEVDSEAGAYILADKVMLDTIIRNLIINAIKFSNTGEIIKVKTRGDNGYFDISIIDNGVGIKPEDMSKLFKIDVHFTTLGTAREKGTGLGLILCKEYLEKTGGTIRVESEYKKGSIFSFSVPAE